MHPHKFKLIAISGGIGSGKSVVAEILRLMGYPVYDCDVEAKHIMDGDPSIHRLLCSKIHPGCVKNGVVDRPLISEIVFNNPSALSALNGIVHGAVLSHLRNWCEEKHGCGHSVMFVESAIIRSSGLINIIDEEWRVRAPLDIRISRVQKRSALNPEQILARIRSQAKEESGPDELPIHYIDNSVDDSLLFQIHSHLACRGL